jgi:exopolyphosphatase/guanosine-5'-triphosphate,3'-diphosphate pyrophosphatase
VTGSTSPPIESAAAVDLGSNSFHMIVARLDSGRLVVVDRLREMVRLAGGLGPDRRLDRSSQNRALACLRRFGERIHHLPPGGVRAVGTNTLRSARNAAKFIAKAEAALGHPIETVSGIEEARLIYLGVSNGFPGSPARRLVVDIGGGSTELIIGQGLQPLVMDSLYMGCVSLSQRHFDGGAIDARRWERAELDALQELEVVQARYHRRGWEEAVGSSGTIRAVERIVRQAGWTRGGITAKALRKLRDAMIDAGDVSQLKLEGLTDQRRPVFPGGVAVLTAVFQALEIEEMEHATGALREGLLLDVLGRTRDEDTRDATTAALAERYHVDREHARRVEETAVRLLDQVAEVWDLGDRDLRGLLARAARLHEIGLDIAHAQYHKHGEYVIANSDLMGFTRDEQRLLATLVRAHRRRFPSAVIDELPGSRRRQIERLAVLLRIAVLLHRSRDPGAVPAPAIGASKRTVRLSFANGWLARHPLTRADLQQEESYLGAADVRLEYS